MVPFFGEWEILHLPACWNNNWTHSVLAMCSFPLASPVPILTLPHSRTVVETAVKVKRNQLAYRFSQFVLLCAWPGKELTKQEAVLI